MLVEEIMSKNVVKIDCNKTILEACNEYSNNKVGSLVVMDKDIIVGIITERDIIERVILQEKNPKELKIREIMSINIITVHALATIEKAAQIMRNNNIKKLPVILNNEIVGIVTETDLSRTIHVFSESVEELKYFYLESKESIEKILSDWEDLIIKIRSYRKLAMQKVNEENLLKNNEENLLKNNEEDLLKKI